ncbi:uncharacterized protein LOC119390975 [Rhipicephalus sanguineus]|uniref:uncharacterized protein LOC119390975 n=1 Tax=Rhipicephalus sanguineus TaxID=34632 RepID=UPI0018934A0A|nr:uncharacterized protein LOC119390975 [Rhipicephalus sanguineus]
MESGTHVQHLWRNLQLVWFCSSLLIAVHCLEPMKGFDPEKFLGKWWIVRATASVFHHAEQCTYFMVNRKAERLYNMTAEFSVAGDRTRRLSLDLEDGENPSEYTASLNDKPIIWVTMLGTDYNNWALVHIREGKYVSTAVASRNPSLDPELDKDVRSVLDKNQLPDEFHTVRTSDCPDTR